MDDTQVLLGKIASLRQRLEQAQGLVKEAGSAAAALAKGPGRVWVLERQVKAGAEHAAQLDGPVRQVLERAGGAAARELPAQLTSRARRLLEQGRDMLARLRALGEEAGLAGEGDAIKEDDEPLADHYRETAAMVETAVRTIQALPDAPSAQLRLCGGMEPLLGLVARRLESLADALGRRRREADRTDTLADLLAALEAGGAADVQPFAALAEAVLADAAESRPLRFLYAGPASPARFAACHGLNVAQVLARLVRHDPDLRARPAEAVLAALVHDAGMARVPAAVLAHPGPLDDEQKRLVERHCRAGAELALRLVPGGDWLAEAAAGHHERLDGTGYPGGLRDTHLSPLTRLVAVCDTYAALCAPRPHRPARDPRAALADTLLLAEQGLLDRFQAERLLRLSFYPVGSVVELSDGSAAGVVAVHPAPHDLSALARPVVVLLADARGRPLPAPRPLDLAQCDEPSVVRTLPPAERRGLLGRHYPEWV